MTENVLSSKINPNSLSADLPLGKELRQAFEVTGRDIYQRAANEISDLQLDRDCAVDFIKKVYEAVHCKEAPPRVDLLKLADETVGEIERWKVLAPEHGHETNRDPRTGMTPAEAEASRLKAALLAYGSHTDDCGLYGKRQGEPHECTCGLFEAQGLLPDGKPKHQSEKSGC